MLKGLVYLSAADPLLSEDDIRDILDVAITHNADVGVTGLLLYSGASFVQVLEGERAAVGQIMDRIFQDRRHSDVTILTTEPIKKRSFADWSMAYREIDADAIARLYRELNWHPAQKPIVNQMQCDGSKAVIKTIRDLFGNPNKLRV